MRQGNPAKYSDIPTLVEEVVGKVPDAQVMADLDATAARAAANGGAAFPHPGALSAAGSRRRLPLQRRACRLPT